MCCPYNYCLRLYVKWMISILLLHGDLSLHVWTIPSFICRTNLGMYCWFVNGFLRLELNVWCVKQLKTVETSIQTHLFFIITTALQVWPWFHPQNMPIFLCLKLLYSIFSHPYYSKQELHNTCPPNQELHTQPHLPTFYHNTLMYCILTF